MFRTKLYLGIWLLLISSVVSLSAQQAVLAAANAVVPPVVKYSGLLTDASSKPLTGTVGVTFSLYKESQGGPALWVETQNVALDKAGHYSAMLGSTTSQGLPADLFASGEARWLGVQAQGEAEQPRTLLMSVPYALKALDAETIGGKPLSALQLAAPNGGSSSSNSNNAPIANTITCSTSSACKSGHIPVFASNGGAAKIKDSIITESGSTLNIAGSETLTGPISASTTSSSSAAVVGNDNTSGGSAAVAGTSTNGTGVVATGITGLLGTGAGEDGVGVSASGNLGVYANGIAAGVYGVSTTSTGVIGTSTNYIGVYGSGGATGVTGVSSSGPGVVAQSATAWAVDAYGTSTATGVLAGSASGWAAWFNGNVDVDGNLSKAGGSFKIDHPLDPANKYLYHSFVESPDMMNIYNGNVTTDAQGDAVVPLPEWFETLNRDFRYQLTVIGQFAQAIVAREIADGRFSIKTDKPSVKVSWQVTGIRQDAWANAHRIPVEQQKPQLERGFYLHPELYGAPEQKGVLWARDPKAMKQWQEARTKAAASNQKPASPTP
ncbi:MAG TPA: hypothetical protein VN950_15515 [Terriglobales bacterium]|nr:hypothetical protein [Terriglobales bacterium]